MKIFFKKYKSELFFWGIATLLGVVLVLVIIFSLSFAMNRVGGATNKGLIKTPEVVKFNINQAEDLLSKLKAEKGL